MKRGDRVQLVGEGGQTADAKVVVVSDNGVSVCCWLDEGQALRVEGGLYLRGPVPLLREGDGYVDLGGCPVGVILPP